MSVQNGFLALLTQGAAYGSQLQSEFLCRAAHRRQLNPGQVYSTLDRMTDQGLVASAGATDDGLPLYELTEAGQDAAAAWLGGAPTDGRPDWDEMQDQVLIAASLEGVDALVVVDGYRAAYAEKIRYLTHEADSRALLAANRAAELGAKAAIEWLDEVAATLRSHPGALVQPRSPERPRRGRRPAAEAPAPQAESRSAT
jgi:DNA-binding PadR family transcriptional regulator